MIYSRFYENICIYWLTLHFRMPKYAVAVGRKVGIYDTWDECKKQTINYPGAKFKKFDSSTEAEKFICDFSKKANITYGTASISSSDDSEPLLLENKSLPELIKLEKISPSNVTINTLFHRIVSLEESLNKFMSTTTSSLENIKKRIFALEKCVTVNNIEEISEPPFKQFKPCSENSNDSNFIRNNNNIVMVYTDGACSNNGQRGAKAGIGVWFNHNHPLNISAPVEGPPTNNNAEIQAARIAIHQARKADLKQIIVHTDSKFLISCINDWIHKWKKNDWQLSTGGPVKNKTEIVKLDSAIQEMESVEWIYVAGHKGVEGNEMADKLAREGALSYNSICRKE